MKKVNKAIKNTVYSGLALGAGNAVLGGLGQGAIGAQITNSAMPFIGIMPGLATMEYVNKKSKRYRI